MRGKEGTSKTLPAGLVFCQYCRTIESEAAPQRFLSWRTKGTSSQNPASAPEVVPNKTPGTQLRLQAMINRPAMEQSLLREWRSETGGADLAAEVTWMLCCGATLI